MSAYPVDPAPWTFGRQRLETELLAQVRLAEAEFKQADADHKEAASERYREALQRFSELILDRRIPPGFSIHV